VITIYLWFSAVSMCVIMLKVFLLQKLNAKDLIKLNFFKNAEGIQYFALDFY